MIEDDLRSVMLYMYIYTYIYLYNICTYFLHKLELCKATCSSYHGKSACGECLGTVFNHLKQIFKLLWPVL